MSPTKTKGVSQARILRQPYHVRDLSLAAQGKARILWADRDMPVLAMIRERFGKEKPLRGRRVSACLHVTAETGNLMRTLKAGGAELVLVASNPLSTQDDVAASLVKDFGVRVYAIKGEDRDTYYAHLDAALRHTPVITMDDGADLVHGLHTTHTRFAKGIIASLEETTTGVNRLRALERQGELLLPVFAVNDAETKHLFDNRYGTGQSTMDGILRSTNLLLAGLKVVIAGYGWCGRGCAMRARGLGADVIVTEVNPTKAIEAVMDSYRVMSMNEAARIGDIFITVTGNKSVLSRDQFQLMKDGAVMCNAGHFNVEIDIPALEKLASGKRRTREFVDEYAMPDGRKLHLLGEGRLINLAAAEGHPASVMDMSFANQALSVEYLVKHGAELENKVYPVPPDIDKNVARLKLEAMGLKIDRLTPEQEAYLATWSEGT